MLTQILLIALIVLAWLGVRSILRDRQRLARENQRVEEETRDAGRDRGTSSTPARTEDMVQCAQCGVYVPRSECVQHRGETFCSDAHRAQHGRRGH